MNPELSKRIRIGVSACLIGEKVRYDGADKLDTYIAATLAHHFDFVAACPEVDIGLGVPREPIRLEGRVAAPRAIGVLTKSLDVTDALVAQGRRTARTIGTLSGYVFKSRSPSCGVQKVPVHGGSDVPDSGRGLFAREIMAARPLLPVIDEGRLSDPGDRDNFLERVFAYRRWQMLEAEGMVLADLQEFHAAHKLVVMAHNPGACHALGRLVAGGLPPEKAAPDYAHKFMKALALPATVPRHANVMHHLFGYLKNKLHATDKAELIETIERYRLGQLPRAVPLALLRHHFRHHPDDYVSRQQYLYPSKEESDLRGL